MKTHAASKQHDHLSPPRTLLPACCRRTPHNDTHLHTPRSLPLSSPVRSSPAGRPFTCYTTSSPVPALANHLPHLTPQSFWCFLEQTTTLRQPQLASPPCAAPSPCHYRLPRPRVPLGLGLVGPEQRNDGYIIKCLLRAHHLLRNKLEA